MTPSWHERARRFAVCALAALASSTCAKAQEPPPAPNEAWAEHMARQLALSPAQREGLQGFVATMAQSGQISGVTEDQLRAMSLVQRFDEMSRLQDEAAASVRAGAAALHRFYDSLSPAQKAEFDRETELRTHASVAADVQPGPSRERPDYRLPAYTEPDWLIKPSAKNIGRVYPSLARQQRIEGKVTLACSVDTDGYLSDCVVADETPAGHGFGNAALEVTGYMRMKPATAYGVPVTGHVRVPVNFTLPAPSGAAEGSTTAAGPPAAAKPD